MLTHSGKLTALWGGNVGKHDGSFQEREILKLVANIGIMASGPITSWEIDGETVEKVSDFIFGGSKITADGDCSHELKATYSLEEKL